MNTNLKQIKSLRASKIQSPAVKQILAKRVAQANKEAKKLRSFAALKSGKVADHCNKLASEIEQAVR